MILKHGVRIHGARPELLLGLNILDNLAVRLGLVLRITSVIDGVHSVGSLHYAGCAADIGCKEFSSAQKQDLLNAGSSALGEDFDLILESVDLPNEHLHLEYQPKRGYVK